MRNVYRAKTMYQLLIILLVLDESKENKLYLDAEDLFLFKDKLNDLNFFSNVQLQKVKRENKFFRFFFTFLNAFLLKSVGWLFKKDRIIYTSQHNIRGAFFKELLHSKYIILIEDGFTSYNEFPDGIKNSLYLEHKKDFFVKAIFNSYFLNIENDNIEKYFYTSPLRLKDSIPRVYNYIKDKIVKTDITSRVIELPETYKNKLKSLFFDNQELQFENKKSVVLLTQPLLEDRKLTESEMSKVIDLFDKTLDGYKNEGYAILIKQHPREKNFLYKKMVLKYGIQEIDKNFPFELLTLFGVKFDVGITYYSTSVESEIFNHRRYLRNEIKNL